MRWSIWARILPLVGFSTRLQFPRNHKDMIVYRSYKHFDEIAYKKDMADIPHHVGEVFDDIDDRCWFTQTLISSVINEHAPMKKKKPVKKPVPFMNSQLRKVCHRKAMLQNRYFKGGRKKQDWEAYRRVRNLSTKLKAKSMRYYFDSKCNEIHKNKPRKFWDTIKPFVSGKSKNNNECGMLNINGTVCNDSYVISQEFNNHICNIVKDICKEPPLMNDECLQDIFSKYNDHESIVSIKAQHFDQDAFHFNEVNEDVVLKLLNSLDSTKSAGYDNIPASLVKTAAEELSLPTMNIVNQTIRDAKFPHGMKLSEIAPIFKTSDVLDRDNYRPVNILPCLSKIVEKIFYEQLYEFFSDILSTFLAAFRKMYGCHHVLTKLIHDCKQALDKGLKVGIILMDLSKAFDCIPHGLLLTKLKCYGLSDQACLLLKSYITDRKQRVKVGHSRSEWGSVAQGVPQGSILGPLIFNIFLNDIFYVLEKVCNLYNYADDNTLLNTHHSIADLKYSLETSATVAIQWFDVNGIKSNRAKFQAMILNNQPDTSDISLCVNDMNIPLKPCVKLLGVFLDCELNFSDHVTHVCKRASRQLNAVRRVAKYLNKDCLMKLFHAFIISNLNYCAIVWHFCSKSSTIKMEKNTKSCSTSGV